MPHGSASTGRQELLTLRTGVAGLPVLLLDGIEIKAAVHPDHINLTIRASARGRLNTYSVQLPRGELPFTLEEIAGRFPAAIDNAMITRRSTLMQILRSRVEIEMPAGSASGTAQAGHIVLKEAGDASALLHGKTVMSRLSFNDRDDLAESYPAPPGLIWKRMKRDLPIHDPAMAFYPSVIHLRNKRRAPASDWFALLGEEDNRFLGSLVFWKDEAKPDRKPPYLCAVFFPCLMTCKPRDDLFDHLLAHYGQVLVGQQREGYLLREYHLDVEPDEALAS